MTTAAYLIVGLGNPGRRYRGNRHNVGFRCVDRLAALHGLTFDKRQKKGRLALGNIRERRVVLLKPQTFMNKSGEAVVPIANFYSIPPEQMLVIYDDLDLPPGSLRLRPGGGSGGHKGMRSIIEQMGRQDFPRLRIGIGRPPGRMDPAAYVLQDFPPDEEPQIAETLERATAAIEVWLTEGLDAAMTQYNRGG